MPIRIWPILLVGFSTLVLLIAFSGFSALERARSIYSGISELHETEQRVERILAGVRSDILSSAIVARDVLYQTSGSVDPERRELQRLQKATAKALGELKPLIPPEDSTRLETMRQDLNDYWHSLDALFLWTPKQKAQRNRAFLRDEILPRRQAALALLDQVHTLSRDSIEARRRDIDRRESDLPVFVSRLIGATILLGVMVAFASAVRIFTLESNSSKQQAAVVAAGEELRNLSRRLVQTQEEERRSLSRELHDQIGQLLTAIRIGAGNLEDELPSDSERARLQLEQIKRLSEQALRGVRDLAMGLRPAMLDDLGLGAALQWQARQHSRLCGVPVSVSLDGTPDDLPDSQRTCVYRVVQEALNNIAKHAQARKIEVSVKRGAHGISILVSDDGPGFDVAAVMRGSGLGLLGIKERVRQLGGEANIESQHGSGTKLTAWLPS